MRKIYNPYCLVNLYYYEVSGQVLNCEKCIFCDTCSEYQIAKKFKIITDKNFKSNRKGFKSNET